LDLKVSHAPNSVECTSTRPSLNRRTGSAHLYEHSPLDLKVSHAPISVEWVFWLTLLPGHEHPEQVRASRLGKAVQVDPFKPMFKAFGTKGLETKTCSTLSILLQFCFNFSFNFKLRRYTLDDRMKELGQPPPPPLEPGPAGGGGAGGALLPEASTDSLGAVLLLQTFKPVSKVPGCSA